MRINIYENACGSFVIRALQNEIEHARQEGLEKRRNTLAAKKVAAEHINRVRALSRKPRPQKPKAEPKAVTRNSSRIAACGEKSPLTKSPLAVPALPPSKVNKWKSGASEKPPSRIVILKVSPEITESPEVKDIFEVKQSNEIMESTELIDSVKFTAI
ncbi:hypothetical protein BDV97DRAFT_152408 [Delphinella strobiligena]|nr:hypothetical protein BDV97DRAFT_152408 [Delphinella strobiligena]